MLSRHKFLFYIAVAVFACSFFLSFPETGHSQYSCCQNAPNTCNDNSGNGGGVVCNAAENVFPGEFCDESNGLCTSFTKDVPTLSEWGLITMAGLLGFIGYMVIRRRKATA